MPLIHGYSEASIAENIGEMVASGRHSSAQAAAAAFGEARRAYREKHPRGPLPEYLRKRRGTTMNHAGVSKKSTHNRLECGSGRGEGGSGWERVDRGGSG